MMQIRLVPLVLFAATSLLTLKAFDMIFTGATLTSGPSSAYAEDKKPDEKKEGEAAPAAVVERPKEYIVPYKGEASAEHALNDRLGDKRRALEEKNKELELRENLLKAAEQKLDDRTKENQLDNSTAQAQKLEDENSSKQIKNLVVMYETMKPKEAAAIFNSLEMGVLIEVVTRMKPQITALILAKMATPAAQKLTVEMAKRSTNGDKASFAASAKGGAQAGAKADNAPKELKRIDMPQNNQ